MKAPSTSEEGGKERIIKNGKHYLLRSFEKMKKKQELSFSLKRKNKMLIEDQEENLLSQIKKDSALIVKEMKIKKEFPTVDLKED